MYEVVWSMDVVASSPEQAAKIACEMQRDPNRRLSIFAVKNAKLHTEGVYDAEYDPPRKLS